MKNIHVLPTDKLSRVFLNKVNSRLLLENMSNPSLKNILPSGSYQNIYITSDEEIKDLRPHKGKWQLEKGEILNKFPNYLTDLSECKLVIMTTDQDLIKDGVQSIDDDFLEWFVKNPSCESVKWNAYPISPNGNIVATNRPYPFEGLISNFKIAYKIIIPKEELKQEYNNLNYGGGFTEEDIKRVSERKPKQETLEEAVKKYSEKEYSTPKPLAICIDFARFGANWQAERMYSEEEVYRKLHNLMTDIKLYGVVINDDIDLKKWFEQFKKK
jgi:hypothetical protein